MFIRYSDHVLPFYEKQLIPNGTAFKKNLFLSAEMLLLRRCHQHHTLRVLALLWQWQCWVTHNPSSDPFYDRKEIFPRQLAGIKVWCRMGRALVFLFSNDTKGINVTTLASLTVYPIQPLSSMLVCMLELGPNSLWNTRIILNSFMLKTPSQNFYVYCVPKSLVDQHNDLGERNMV